MIRTLISTSLILLLAISTSGQSIRTPEKPINCETFQALLDFAIIDWRRLEGTHMIIITRLGTGETDKRLHRLRHYYVEEYIQKRDVRYVFAAGERVKGYGRFEVYVGGRLNMSVPIQKGARRLCYGNTGA